MNNALNHEFTGLFGSIDLKGIRGYQQCLLAFYQYIEKKTEYNPNKRMIDSVELLEAIEDTNKELAVLIAEAGKDAIQTTLNSLNKATTT